jgi:DNA polymerase III alpha subunit
MAFAELCATSNFTFLTGGSHPQEYALRAIELGLPAFAIADRNSVAGLVRAHQELREAAREGGAASRLVPAARLCLAEGTELTALPRNRAGWARLCRLLTLGARRAPKGSCELHADDLGDLGDLHLLLHPPAGRGLRRWLPQAKALARRHGHAHLVASPRYDGQDAARLDRLERLAGELGLPLVASAEPIMHDGARRRLVDVLTCIRTGRRIDALGRAALANAERRLRSEAEMLRLFAGHEAAVHRAGAIAEECTFRLDELRYEYPKEVWEGEEPQARLERLTAQGLKWRYPLGVPERVAAQAAHELALIGRLSYAPYFLTVSDVVDYARGQGILCQGRGSAANSVVCFALGVTSVSPEIGTMVFERFVSAARR